MSKLRKLEKKFKKGLIKKENYIREMHNLHLVLWDYLEFIRDKNIDSIEISGKQILFKTKEGVKMICDIKDERAAPIEILNFKDYEPNEIKMIRKFLRKNSILLDVGANIGWYSSTLAVNVPKGRILAFEPVPKTYRYLKKNIAINNIKNVRLYNFGLSDKKGEGVFYYEQKLSGATSLRNLHENRKKIKIKCKLKRLDDFINKIISRIDFIKCDVEGAEIFVIKGGIETIKKYLPILFLEMLRKWSAKYEYHPNDIIKILSEIGYNCYFVQKCALIKIKEINQKTTATNFYFLHNKKHKNLLCKIALNKKKQESKY